MRGNPNRWEIEALPERFPWANPVNYKYVTNWLKLVPSVAPKHCNSLRTGQKHTPVQLILKGVFRFGAKECKN